MFDEVLSPKALFVIACVILAVSMVTFALSMVYVQSVTAPSLDTGSRAEKDFPRERSLV